MPLRAMSRPVRRNCGGPCLGVAQGGRAFPRDHAYLDAEPRSLPSRPRGMSLDPLLLLALAGAGMLAGFVDAIAGGGGLIALPALLAAGVPPIAALGTNKVQSVIGTAAAALTYWRGGYVSLKALAVAIPATLAAAFVGAFVVKQIDVSILSVAVPGALIAIALYFLFAPRLSDDDRHSRLRWEY